MNIDKVLVARSKRTALLQSIGQNSTKRTWVLLGALGAWGGSMALEATAPNFAPTTVGSLAL